MAFAEARHILVKTEKECLDLKQQIESGTDFAEIAKKHSQCPSGKQGGSLGRFSPGKWFLNLTKSVSTMKSGKFTDRLRPSLAIIWLK